MTALLNEVTTNEDVTSYDRAAGGAFENPYGGVPSLRFYMHRVKFLDSDPSKLLSESSLPCVDVPYVPGVTYDMYNPATGEKIPGVTFTSDQFFAMMYSLMMNKVAADAAAS